MKKLIQFQNVMLYHVMEDIKKEIRLFVRAIKICNDDVVRKISLKSL